MIIRQCHIYRADLRANPNVLYIFGDNVERVGKGGQAAEMRGEPNAVGVATKWTPGHSESDYFDDSQYDNAVKIIRADFEVAEVYHHTRGIVVVPMDGIGTGLSELPERAPRIYAYIVSLGLGAKDDS